MGAEDDRLSSAFLFSENRWTREVFVLDVFFYEVFEEEERSLRKRLPSGMTAGFTRKTIQERGDAEPPASLVSVRDQSVIPVDWADKLSGILTRSTGYDHIIGYREQCGRNIPCGYLPLYCHRAVAEQAMLLWMALLRKLPKQREQFNRFHRDGLTGEECAQKTLLVVGVGNIGFEVVKIGRGLGMDVLGVDIVEKHDSVSYVSIDEGIGRAEVIVCAMNLTSENVDYFDYRLLRKTRPAVVFVNIARGKLSPSGDLLRLVEEGHLGGVGLDVYSNESELAVALRSGRTSKDVEVQATLALAKHPRVILTPHNAFNTREAVERKVDHSFQQISHFLREGRFLWPVPVV